MRLSRWACFVSVVVLLCTAGPACAVITNGGFEEFAVGAEFNTPLNWETFNYCAVDANFVPEIGQGSAENWKIDVDAGLYPVEGENFVVLSTGNLEPWRNYWGARISQRIEFNSGDRVTGSYFFGTCDYLSEIGPYFYDWAEIKAVLVADPNVEISLIDRVLNVPTIGEYSSTAGWQDFQYIFGEHGNSRCNSHGH